MKVLELFSGIGGMHLALLESGVQGEVKCSIDVNPIANKIYVHNFPGTPLLNANIEGLTADKLNRWDADTILMSPPCQPFTRNGLQKDVKDARTNPFIHILGLLPELNIQNILIENVKGFETSEMRNTLVNVLEEHRYVYQEFILSPHQLGVPNTRHRYFCLAKKKPNEFGFDTRPLMYHLPGVPDNLECFSLSTIMDRPDEIYRLPDNILKKRATILDICHPDSKRSCCFTKTYGRFIEGTGSVFTDKSPGEVNETYTKVSSLDVESDERMELLRGLNLRFFTPKEVSRLMCFPESFSFPDGLSNKAKYQVLGNSVNVKVVVELIKLL